ncbi:hypothetical protein M413DRAFT_450012, partial [Hebeloma cylindrosporum]
MQGGRRTDMVIVLDVENQWLRRRWTRGSSPISQGSSSSYAVAVDVDQHTMPPWNGLPTQKTD